MMVRGIAVADCMSIPAPAPVPVPVSASSWGMMVATMVYGAFVFANGGYFVNITINIHIPACAAFFGPPRDFPVLGSRDMGLPPGRPLVLGG
jgi:hypothetical protein